jgi:hypothetical protein
MDEDKWYTNLPNAPNPRDHTGGALINGRICVAGGRDSGSIGFFKNVFPTDCYDPSKKTWTVEASIPMGRANAAYGTTCDGKLMVAGGRGGNDVIQSTRGKGGDDVLTGGGGDGKSRVGKGGGDDVLTGGGDDKVWTNVHVFDGTTWTTVPSLRVPRYGTSLAVDCGNGEPGLPAKTCLDAAGNSVECLRLPGGTGLMADVCNKQTHVAGGSSTPAGDVELVSVETLFPFGVDLRCFV